MSINIADIAKVELKLWRAQDLIECVRHPTTSKPIGNAANEPGSLVVAKYWREGVGDNHRNGCTDVPWSAAFICWCIRQVGVALEAFPFSGSHQAYIRWAIRNTKLDKSDKLYYGMKASEYRPQPGDLIAQWRKEKVTDPDPNITFDNLPDTFFASHCDIVVSAAENKIVAIGGNLGNRVKETSFGAIDGILKPKKAIICIMRLANDA